MLKEACDSPDTLTTTGIPKQLSFLMKLTVNLRKTG